MPLSVEANKEKLPASRAYKKTARSFSQLPRFNLVDLEIFNLKYQYSHNITSSCPSPAMVSRHLSFVNISRPDQGQSKRTKALVRRHVMADVGRSRRKKAKYKIIPLQVAATDPPSDTIPENAAAAGSAPLVRMPPSFQTFLIGSDARASELITFS